MADDALMLQVLKDIRDDIAAMRHESNTDRSERFALTLSAEARASDQDIKIKVLEGAVADLKEGIKAGKEEKRNAFALAITSGVAIVASGVTYVLDRLTQHHH